MRAEELADFIGHAIQTSLAAQLAPLFERIAVLETKAAQTADADAARDLAAARERIAVLEVKAPIPGPAGAPGRDGVDGLGFDDLRVEYDGERSFVFQLQRGDVTKEVGRAVVPVVLYRDVWNAAKDYAPGDAVTYGGSVWLCKAATTARPDTADGAGFWRLMVKRGDRGRDLRVPSTEPAPKVYAHG